MRKAGEERYFQTLHEIFSGDKLPSGWESRLGEVAKRYGLSPQSIHNVDAKFAKEVFREAAAHDRVSSEEEKRIELVCDSLGVPVDRIIGDRRNYNRMRILALLDVGRLPGMIESSLLLRPDETCHYEDEAWLLGEKIETYYVGYSEGSAVDLIGGVEFQEGSFYGKNVTRRKITGVDRGNFSITSERLIFTGLRQTITMPLPNVTSVKLFADALAIHTDNLSVPTNLRIQDPEVIGALISAVVRRHRGQP